MEKKSEKDIERETKRLLAEIDILKKETQEKGLSFKSLTKEEIMKKLRGEASKSPFIYSQSWGGGVRGGQTYVLVFIRNPESTYYSRCFVSLFFGVCSFLRIGRALTARDRQWPCLSTEYFHIPPEANVEKRIDYTIPIDVPLTTHIGNIILWQGRFFDRGVYLDRSYFWQLPAA